MFILSVHIPIERNYLSLRNENHISMSMFILCVNFPFTNYFLSAQICKGNKINIVRRGTCQIRRLW